jgi:MFS family permease
MRELPDVVAADGPFRRFHGGMAIATFGAMGASFLVVYGSARFGASDELAAWYTVALLVAQVVATLPLGWLADRHGFTAVGMVSALASLGLAAGALLAPDAVWLLAAFGLLGLNQAANMLARLTGPMDFAPAERRPTYLALTGALLGLVAAIGPLLAGQLVDALGYEWLFGLCAIISLVGTLALWPGSAPRRDPRAGAVAPG